MTRPMPYDNTEDFEVLRKRWLSRYMKIQSQTDTRIRTILVQSAEDAAKIVTALEKNSTFSAGVRIAQIKLVMNEIKDILDEIFSEITPVISAGQKSEAEAASDGLAETDREYLKIVFQDTGAVRDYLDSQRFQAKIQLVNAVNRITKS
jgi:hypothetical protein